MNRPILTITGADDSVRPFDLIELSARYPFVEWGILWSKKRQGTPRYPSDSWIDLLAWHASRAGERPNLSLHLCGAAAREVMCEGKLDGLVQPFARSDAFQRAQFNGFDTESYEQQRNLYGVHAFRIEPILQVREAKHLEAAAFVAADVFGSVLYDPSGGRGKAPAEWPALPDCKAGVAGGLRPGNVRSTFLATAASWVDIESGVRTDDQFDLAKVRAVLDEMDAP